MASSQEENSHFAARHPRKMGRRTIDRILFVFHGLGNGVRFHRVHEDRGQMQMLTPAGKTLRLPVAERLFA
jgi:hypothetical protein